MREQAKIRGLEVLAPAGSYETFLAVIRAGADAVYLGGNRFGARAYADNFKEEELLRAIDHAHIHGRKVYLTVNTLLKEAEFGQLYDYLRPYYEAGLDAVIVQDMGALTLIREEFAGMDIHISTQMTVTGAYGAAYMKELGASRIVTARELSLDEIAQIRRAVDIEIETFVHGALCYCYSGQCLFSSMLGGRSGNRGKCAQPCRLPYEVYGADKKKQSGKGAFVLSPKDLCGVADIPALAKSGVSSLKIEGRMKQAEYAAGVVAVYRGYVDRYMDAFSDACERGMKEQEAHAFAVRQYQVIQEDMQRLFELGNRSGFTDGYYHKKNGKDMITFGKPNHARTNEALQEEIRARYVHAKEGNAEIKEKINGILRLKKDSPATMEVSSGGVSVSVSGSIVQAARSQPLSAEKAEVCIRQTGNTPFVFENLTIDAEEDGFLPVQALKQMRREALEVLETALLSKTRRSISKDIAAEWIGDCGRCRAAAPQKCDRELFIASVENRRQAAAALESDLIAAVYYDSTCYGREKLIEEFGDDVAAAHEAGKEAYLILPAVFRRHTADFYRENKEELLALGADGIVVKSYDAAGFVHTELADRLPVIFDYNIYTWNEQAKRGLWKLAPLRDTVPLELNRREIRGRDNRGSELIIYGYLPLMTSAQCVHANTAGCDKKGGLLYLKDRYGKYFPVKNQCGECYNVIYNTLPLMLFGTHKECIEAGIAAYRLSFTIEDEEQVREILHICKRSFLFEQEDFKKLYHGDYTNGHYKRGVE